MIVEMYMVGDDKAWAWAATVLFELEEDERRAANRPKSRTLWRCYGHHSQKYVARP